MWVRDFAMGFQGVLPNVQKVIHMFQVLTALKVSMLDFGL